MDFIGRVLGVSLPSSLAAVCGRLDSFALQESSSCLSIKKVGSCSILCQVTITAERSVKSRGLAFEGLVAEKKQNSAKQHRTWSEGQKVSAEKHLKKLKELRRKLEEQSEQNAKSEHNRGGPVTPHELQSNEDELVAPERQLSRSSGDASSSADLNCQHFSRCPGCVLNIALDQPPILREATRFFAQHSINDFSFHSGSVWEWRCRAKLAVRGTPDNPQIGIFGEGTHSVVTIPACRAHHPRINEAVELLKAAIKELGVQPYDEASGTGELRYVQMVVSTYNTALPEADRYKNGKVQISLVWNARDEESFEARQLEPLVKLLWRKAGAKSVNPVLHSVWANFQTTQSNVIFGGKWRHMLGEKEMWERVGGIDICFTPSSFGQANLQEFEALLRRLQKSVRLGSNVVELYGGVGVIGLSLAAHRSCRVVKCVEVNKNSRVPFELSLARLPRSVESKISWHCADASVSPIQWLQGSDVVVVDPPRRGLDPSVVEALRTASLRGQGKSKPPTKISEKVEKRPWILRAQQGVVHNESPGDADEQDIWPDTLVYVSCGWEAFKEDTAALILDGSWHLAQAAAFNMFPGTDSMEVLAVFKRGKKVKSKVKSTMTKARLAKGKAKKSAKQKVRSSP